MDELQKYNTYCYCGNINDSNKLRNLTIKNKFYSIENNIIVNNLHITFHVISEYFVKNNQKNKLIKTLELSPFFTKSSVIINDYKKILTVHDKRIRMRLIVKNDVTELIIMSRLPRILHTETSHKILSNNDISYIKESYTVIETTYDKNKINIKKNNINYNECSDYSDSDSDSNSDSDSCDYIDDDNNNIVKEKTKKRRIE